MRKFCLYTYVPAQLSSFENDLKVDDIRLWFVIVGERNSYARYFILMVFGCALNREFSQSIDKYIPVTYIKFTVGS